MEILKEDIAQRISEERERIGYNQTGFARQLEITAETLRRYEMGLRDASLDFLVKAATLGVDVQYVLTGIRSINIEKVEKAYSSIKLELDMKKAVEDADLVIESMAEYDEALRGLIER